MDYRLPVGIVIYGHVSCIIALDAVHRDMRSVAHNVDALIPAVNVINAAGNFNIHVNRIRFQLTSYLIRNLLCIFIIFLRTDHEVITLKAGTDSPLLCRPFFNNPGQENKDAIPCLYAEQIIDNLEILHIKEDNLKSSVRSFVHIPERPFIERFAVIHPRQLISLSHKLVGLLLL